jgi:hypothetical protein
MYLVRRYMKIIMSVSLGVVTRSVAQLNAERCNLRGEMLREEI